MRNTDDLLLTSDSLEAVGQAADSLTTYLQHRGWAINPPKVQGPGLSVKFLGVAREAGERVLFSGGYGCLSPPVDDFATVVGAAAQQEEAYLLGSITYGLRTQVGMHKSLYMPGSPKLLFWQDLLEQTDAEIKLNKSGAKGQTALPD